MRCRPSDTPRKPVNQLTEDEILQELLVDPITRISNRRAWNEMEKGLALAWIDADGPECLADESARALCERHLQAIGAALQEAMPSSVAYLYGDIFVAHAKTRFDLRTRISNALDMLSSARTQMTRPDGVMTELYGMGFSYGLAGDLPAAEAALYNIRRGAHGTGFALPAGGRLPYRLKPLLKLGYKVTQVRLAIPGGTIKEY